MKFVLIRPYAAFADAAIDGGACACTAMTPAAVMVIASASLRFILVIIPGGAEANATKASTRWRAHMDRNSDRAESGAAFYSTIGSSRPGAGSYSRHDPGVMYPY